MMKSVISYAAISVLTAGLIVSCTTASPDQATSESTNSVVTDSVTTESVTTESTTPATEPSQSTATESIEAIQDQVAEAVKASIYVENGVAIRGTDPVAYFEQGGPVQGSDAFAYEWMGVTWHFSSAENRDRFVSNPEAYAPQYGGYCAWAAAEGYLAPIDPGAWAIVEGQLYLNFNRSVQRRWERDIPGNIARANANWPDLSSQ